MTWTSETAPRNGRPPGSPNKLTADLRDAIRQAAEEGEPDGLVGYYRKLKDTLPEKFSDHMRAMIPRDMSIDATVTATHAAIAQAAAEIPEYAVRAALEAIRLHEAEKARVQLPENAT